MPIINQVGNSLTGLTGTGAFVGANTPTLITPVLGAATGTSVVLSGKLTANNSINGFATTATAGATTTLTVSSAQNQEFTGSTTQIVVMPITSTLVTGQQYYIINNSSGIVTVQSSGANTIQAMAANSSLLLTVVNTAVTTAAGWESAYIVDTGLAGAVLLTPAGDQTITVGDFHVANGRIFSGDPAGSSLPGKFIAYSPTAAKGTVQLQCVDNAGDFSVNILNAVMGQNTNFTIPDPVSATASFLLSTAGATQHITAFNLQADAGGFITGLSTGGSNNGFIAFSPTAAKGDINIICADNGGNYNNILINASTSAARTWTLPDATGTIQLQGQSLGSTVVTSPAASQSSSLILGTAYQNPFGYDVVLTVYVAVTAATAGSIAVGVGPTNTPTQQNVVTGFTIAALSIIPVTIYLPTGYYALLSLTSVTGTISGQQAMPV